MTATSPRELPTTTALQRKRGNRIRIQKAFPVTQWSPKQSCRFGFYPTEEKWPHILGQVYLPTIPSTENLGESRDSLCIRRQWEGSEWILAKGDLQDRAALWGAGVIKADLGRRTATEGRWVDWNSTLARIFLSGLNNKGQVIRFSQWAEDSRKGKISNRTYFYSKISPTSPKWAGTVLPSQF